MNTAFRGDSAISSNPPESLMLLGNADPLIVVLKEFPSKGPVITIGRPVCPNGGMTKVGVTFGSGVITAPDGKREILARGAAGSLRALTATKTSKKLLSVGGLPGPFGNCSRRMTIGPTLPLLIGKL